MCQQKSPPPKRKQKISGNNVAVNKPAARRSRTKRRKPKYLSLSLKLSPQDRSHHQQSSNKKSKMKQKQQKKQLNLFPLHPGDHGSKLDMHDQESNNVMVASLLFDTATDSTTTLDGLLTASEEGPLSSSPLFSHGSGDGHRECSDYGLVRTAMRCKERDASEERWVSYSEVVDSKKKKIIKEEEGSSCVDDDDDDDAGAWRVKQVQGKKTLSLALKLDYQEVLNAWSDKAPLFVDGGESPQTVPDLYHDPNMLFDAGNSGNLFSVPEMTGNASSFKVDELGKEGWSKEHREASVMRYKEKRQNRLFSKRIRYEVRKLNAEKRPRMKGRFVKRNSEV